MATLTKTGKIRMGKTCPFAKECGMKTPNCPTKGNTRKNEQFSCGVARMFAMAKPIQVKPEPVKLVKIESLADSVAKKQAERNKPKMWVEV